MSEAASSAAQMGMAGVAQRAQDLVRDMTPAANVFRSKGELWLLTFAGTTVRVPDAKGLHDIARLLSTPGQEVPAGELVGLEAAAEATAGSDPVIDEQAPPRLPASPRRTRCRHRRG